MILPIILGFLGTIPLILSSFINIFIIADNIIITKIALSYAAIILSFLGAVHWGYLIQIDLTTRKNYPQWFWGITGSLLGWLSIIFLLFNEIIFSTLVLILGFTISFIFDFKVFKKITWYRKLRIYLTFIALINIFLIGFF